MNSDEEKKLIEFLHTWTQIPAPTAWLEPHRNEEIARMQVEDLMARLMLPKKA